MRQQVSLICTCRRIGERRIVCGERMSVLFHAVLLMAVTSLVSYPAAHAFSIRHRVRTDPTAVVCLEPHGVSSSFRRLLLSSAAFAFLQPANAVVMSSEQKVFKAGEPMGVTDALERFQSARKDLQYLIDNYDEIVANGGGDNVRRYLGTVGVTSALYGISKVMKELQEEADDIVEYTENMNEFDAALRAADTACYSANFVEFSAAKTKPEKFFQDALGDIKNMMNKMNNMADELKIS